MTLKLIAPNATPAYLALSTDISASKIDGATNIGKTVYLTDTEQWKIINTDLTLSPFSVDSVIRDTSGCPIEVHTDVDGGRYLSVAAIQAIHVDPNNSISGSGLPASGSYVGIGTSTLGVSGIQLSFFADQNCMLYVQQSNDNINWDISDPYNFRTTSDFGITTQAVGTYYRIVVVNTSPVATTIFRLQSLLCPIVEALPRSLNSYGRLETSTGIIDEETGNRVETDGIGGLKTVNSVRLAGVSFSGSTLDTNFWSASLTGTGSITVGGEIILATGTTASSIARITSIRKANKVPSASNQFRAVIRHINAPASNCIRRIGAYGNLDGFFFELNGSILGVGSRKSGVDTTVYSGSFNGNLGKSVVTSTSLRRLTITYGSFSAKFFVNDMLLHTISNTDSLAPTNTLSLPCRAEIYNIDGNTTNNSSEVRFMCIVRLGELFGNTQNAYIGTNTTSILKYDAGILRSVIILDNAGTVSLYDSVGTATTPIAVIDAAKVVGHIPFDASFSNGLTVVTATNAKCTVVYE